MRDSKTSELNAAVDKFKSSLKIRITVFLVLFLASIFGIFLAASISQAATVIRYICINIATPTLKRASEAIDGDSFERLIETLNPYDPYYLEAQRKLYDIKEEHGVKYLYTLAPNSTMHIQYIIDGSDVIDGPYFSYLGELESIASNDESAIYATMAELTIQVGNMDSPEEWGALIPVYAPIINSAGEAVGVISCDIDGAPIAAFIRAQVSRQLIVMALLIIAGLAMYVPLMRTVVRFSPLSAKE